MSKEVSRKVIFDAVDGTTDPSSILTPTSVKYQDNAGLVINWTGTLAGTFKVFATNDLFGVNNTPTASNWNELDFGASISLDPTIQAAGILVNMTQLPFVGLYFSYTNASGTGNISVTFASKRIGS